MSLAFSHSVCIFVFIVYFIMTGVPKVLLLKVNVSFFPIFPRYKVTDWLNRLPLSVDNIALH